MRPVGNSNLLMLGNTRLQFFRSGAEDAHPVVLLPAFGRSVSEFNRLVSDLVKAGYQTVAIEPRGVGQSRGPWWPRTTLEDFAEDVRRVVDELELEQVSLIGRAFGNRIARLFSALYPEKVRTIIILGAGGTVPPARRPGLAYLLSRKVRKKWLCAPGNPLPENLANPPTLRAILSQAPALRKVFRRSTQQNAGSQVDDSVGNMWWLAGKARMLIIQGEDDRIAPVENGERLQRVAPNRIEMLTVPQAGHLVLHEQYETVCHSILEFLGQSR